MAPGKFSNLPLPVSASMLALAYFISGRLGLLLAIPPGYATAVWPASGVAVAAILLYGYRLWPGVLLGSFFVNFPVAFDGASLLSIITSLSIAAGIGMGAALQAVIGAMLINRYVDLTSGLTTSNQVGWFLGMGGPVSCLINATWGSTLLWVFKEISAEEYAFNWITWWVGDVIGVIVFLPLMFTFLGRPAKVWQWRRLPVAGPLTLSTAIVVIFFFFASSAEQRRIDARFLMRADMISRALEKQWNTYTDMLLSLCGELSLVQNTQDNSFRHLLKDELKHHPGIRAIEWFPKGSLGNPVSITAPGQLGDGRPPGIHGDFDPAWIALMETAGDTGLPTATPPISPPRESRGQAEVMILVPVYGTSGIPATLRERRQHLRGYAAGIFRTGTVLAQAMKGLEIHHTISRLIDKTGPPQRGLLAAYRVSSDGTFELIPPGEVHSAKNRLYSSNRFEVGGRTWEILTTPTPKYLADNRSWAAWWVLAVGLLFTGLLGAFLLVLTGTMLMDKTWADKLTGLNRELSNEIAERKQSEKALGDSEEKYRLAMEATTDGLWDWDVTSGDVYYNPAWSQIINETQVPPVYASWAGRIHPEDRESVMNTLEAHLKGESPQWEIEHRLSTGTGQWKWVLGRGSVVEKTETGLPLRMVGTMTDISGRKKIEAQLQQAQKMESVGRLAGGVAHDFNNMLSIILGNSEMILEDLEPSDPLFQSLEEVRKAAERSRDLTRQLLAFARKQTISPKVVNLNQIISGMLTMLMRLIGENIDLQWHPRETLWPVKIDPSQIDQLMANLCVNARDAIADVGRIAIETDNAGFGPAYCREHPGFIPGDYAVITVSDTGCGMDRATIDNLFEPFFTTKEFGEGTGLGLSTVYGIVNQNNGFITVNSEPGQGSTFGIYLPRHRETVDIQERKETEEELHQGHGTILLVEDETAILQMAEMMLTRLGYTVFSANTADEAIDISERSAHPIDLLITDVVMPSMNGRQLAEKILHYFPDIKCLYMSGYTADVIVHRGILDEGLNFINKPFTLKGLSVKLRDILRKERRP